MSWYKKAMPINTDYLDNVHDTEIRKHINPKTEIIVYHGTSSKKLLNILYHGSLDPSISSTEEYRAYTDASPGIFVTTNAEGMTGAGLYSHHASQDEERGDGGDPVILELIVPWMWIEPDPDDKQEHLAKIQGVVSRPISIKRIRNIKIENPIIAGKAPSSSSNFFDSSSTQWMPIGKMMDLINKLTQNNYELGEEYYAMSKNRPKGLSRQDPYSDKESDLANGLSIILQTFFSPDSATYDKSLAWVFKNKNNLYGNSLSLLISFINYLGGNPQDMLESMPEDYKPNQGENFASYVKRVSNY